MESSKGKRSEPGLFAILNNPPTNPFVLVDISLFLYRKEKGTKLKVKVGIQQ